MGKCRQSRQLKVLSPSGGTLYSWSLSPIISVPPDNSKFSKKFEVLSTIGKAGIML